MGDMITEILNILLCGAFIVLIGMCFVEAYDNGRWYDAGHDTGAGYEYRSGYKLGVVDYPNIDNYIVVVNSVHRTPRVNGYIDGYDAEVARDTNSTANKILYGGA
jgi:hypothetical protein